LVAAFFHFHKILEVMETTHIQTRRSLKTHFDAVVYFFTKFDSEMISTLLDDSIEYQGFPKHLFIRKLGDLFHDLIKLGDTRLIAMVDDGPLPVNGNFGVTFEGDETSLFMDVVFEVDEIGYITDIYEVADMAEDQGQFSKRQRVFIDQFADSDMTISLGDDDSADDMDDDLFL